MTSFPVIDGRQIFWIGGFKKLGSSTQIWIRFYILLLFFSIDKDGKRFFSLVPIYLKLTEMSRKNKKKEPAPVLWRIGWDGIRGRNELELFTFPRSPFTPFLTLVNRKARNQSSPMPTLLQPKTYLNDNRCGWTRLAARSVKGFPGRKLKTTSKERISHLPSHLAEDGDELQGHRSGKRANFLITAKKKSNQLGDSLKSLNRICTIGTEP